MLSDGSRTERLREAAVPPLLRIAPVADSQLGLAQGAWAGLTGRGPPAALEPTDYLSNGRRLDGHRHRRTVYC